MLDRARALTRLLLAAIIVVGSVAKPAAWAFSDNLTGFKLVVKSCAKACQKRGRPWLTMTAKGDDLALPASAPVLPTTASHIVVSFGSGATRQVIADESLVPEAWDGLRGGKGFSYDADAIRITITKPRIKTATFPPRTTPGRLQVALGAGLPTAGLYEVGDTSPLPIEVTVAVGEDRYCAAFTTDARKNKFKALKRQIVKRMDVALPCVQIDSGSTTTTSTTSTSTSTVEPTTSTSTTSISTSTSFSTTSTSTSTSFSTTSTSTSTSFSTTSTSTSTSFSTTSTSTSTSFSTTSTSTSTSFSTTSTSTSTSFSTTSTSSTTTTLCGLVDLGLTVWDQCSGLEWEKKNGADGVPGSGTMDAGNPNDVDNRYEWAGLCDNAPTKKCQPTSAAEALCKAQVPPSLWSDGCELCGVGEGTCVVDLLDPPSNVQGTAWEWLAQLNSASFANHTDWRLPTSAGSLGLPTGQAAEIESIIEPPCSGGTTLCIDPLFGPTSPTNLYFSASSRLDCAWGIFYSTGNIACNAGNKDNDNLVRAVRVH